jgi:WD40 repeat protein
MHRCSADESVSAASAAVTIAKLDSPRECVMAVAFFNDGRSLVVGSGNLNCGMIRVWTAPDWRLVTTIRAHDKFVYSLAVDPQGEILVSSSIDETVKLWNAKAGLPIRDLTGHSGRIRSVAFSPDGRMIAGAGQEKVVRLWLSATGEPAGLFAGHSDEIVGVAFVPDGTALLSVGNDRVLICWDLATKQMRWKSEIGVASIVGVGPSPDSKTAVTVDNEAAVRLWDVQSGAQVKVVYDPEGLTRSVAWSPDGRWIAVGCGGRVHVYDATTMKVVKDIRGDGIRVGAVAFSHDGGFLGTGGWSGDVTVLPIKQE